MPRGIKRVVKRALPARNRARHRMGDHVTNRVILKKPARVGLGHCWPSFMSGA